MRYVKWAAIGLCAAGLGTSVAISAGLGSVADATAAKAATTRSFAAPWSFGVISDTQWTVNDDGYNPNKVAANIIKQIDQQFVRAGVKLVVAVGDTADDGSKTSIDTRALYAQDLYNAGIAFYPLRGNHEATEGDATYVDSAAEFKFAYPQIGNGVNNNTPAALTSSIIPSADLANNPPVAKSGGTFTVGSSFQYPTVVNSANKSLSYSFTYGGATFVLLDQFVDQTAHANDSNDSTIAQQIDWMNGVLKARPAGSPAFVFAHKNLLGGNHKDNLFGAAVGSTDPGDGNGVDLTTLTADQKTALQAKLTAENAFIACLQANQVPFLISGHDHHDYDSIVTSPDGKSQVHQLIGASDSSKFYTPGTPVSANDTPIQQDLGRVGYYIVTVDGPRVTIDYYADATGGSDYGLNGGTFTFQKRSTMTYSLNGTEKVVAEGAAYAPMSDNTSVASTLEGGFLGTSMSILAGTNGNVGITNYGKKLSNDVMTAWKPARSPLVSDILDLSGMSRSLGSAKTDEYVLSMSYTPNSLTTNWINHGTLGILANNAAGTWVRATSMDFGLTHKYVAGPWNSSYTLGTYGVDTATHTAWAVLNYNGEFAVGPAPGM